MIDILWIAIASSLQDKRFKSNCVEGWIIYILSLIQINEESNDKRNITKPKNAYN